MNRTAAIKPGKALRAGKGLARTPWKRKAPASASAPARRPPAKTPRRNTGPTQAQRATVWARAGGRCERCRVDLHDRPHQVHHRQPRKMGGTSRPAINTPPNLLLLCGYCHPWVEANRTRAYRDGWLVREPTDPATVPLPDGTYLTLDGGYRRSVAA